MNHIAIIEPATLPSLVRSAVYFVQNLTTGDVKIGFTTNLERRVSSLECGSGADLRVMRLVDGGRATEKWLHKRFSSSRRKGEWFSFHDDMLTVIPPDEIARPKKVTVRRDIRLTVKERLRDARGSGECLGLSPKQVLLTFVSSLTDEQANDVLDELYEAVTSRLI